MREPGLPKVLVWRWTPCAAFVLGSLSFIGFALLTIPERIGQVVTESTTGMQLGNRLTRAQAPSAPQDDWSSDGTNNASAAPSPGQRRPTQNSDVSTFPKRGFSPPLERTEPPAPAPPPQPQLNVPPPQPQLNVPPPAAAPSPAPPPTSEPPAQQQAETPAPPAATPPDAPAAAPVPATPAPN